MQFKQRCVCWCAASLLLCEQERGDSIEEPLP